MAAGLPKFVPVCLALAACALAACEPYRVEYRRRPAYYARMADGRLPERVVLDDGTIVLYNERDPDRAMTGSGEKAFQIREEQADGTVVLRALLPQHVVANTLNCLRTEEYELLWDQLLSERTKLAYKEQEQGLAEFAAFCREHRVEMARMLNRMLLGFASNETVVETVAPGVSECRLWPQVASQFRFRRVAITYDGLGLKLLRVY